MKRKARPDIAPSTFVIDVGYVTPFVVFEDEGRDPVAAFHSIGEARAHFPSARVTEGAQRKAADQ